jgi:hypothetical protein
MGPLSTSAGAMIIIGLALQSAAARPDPPEQEPAPPSACVRFWPLARYAAGYDHLVYMTNDCDVAVSCVVSTDVNPEAQVVPIRPQESVVVLTFRGSPARVFTPFVRCAPSRASLPRRSRQ